MQGIFSTKWFSVTGAISLLAISFPQEDTLLFYRRTPCFGKCPSFELLVTPGYTVFWKKGVSPRLPLKKHVLNSIQRRKLRKIIKKTYIQLKKVPDTCVERVSDISTITLYIKKRRYYYHCVGESARHFKDILAPLDRWIEENLSAEPPAH